MTQPTGDIRQLNYPLNRVEGLVVDTPNTPPVDDLTLNWQTTDNDERVPIVLYLSLNEYIALATSVDVGRDLAYGSNSIYIWWIWVRSIMQFCEAMLDCIENDADVRQAISDISYAQTINTLRDNAQAQGSLVLGSGNNPTCDLDALFGGIVSVIDRANQNNVDALEQFEVATNLQELVSLIFPNTFEDGSSVLNAMLDWIAWMQDSIIENYNAQITTAYLEELYCDLFCLVKDDCILTPEILVDYFVSRLSGAITFSSLFTETTTFLITGTWVGSEIADAFFLSQFAIRAQIGGFLSYLGFSDIDRDMRIGFLQPNSTWTVLCTDCPDTWEEVFDFTVSDGGWYQYMGANVNPFGNYVPGSGWSFTNNLWDTGQYRRAIQIAVDFPSSAEVTEIEFTYNYLEGTFNVNGVALNLIDRLSGTIQSNSQLDNTAMVDANDQTHTLTATDTVDLAQIFLCSSVRASALYDGSCLIKSCTIRGNGTNPFS